MHGTDTKLVNGRCICLRHHTPCASFAETMLPLKRGRDEQSAEEGGNDAGAGSGPRRSAAATLDAVLALMQSDFSCSVCHGLVVAPHILACSHRFCGNCIMGVDWSRQEHVSRVSHADKSAARAGAWLGALLVVWRSSCLVS